MRSCLRVARVTSVAGILLVSIPALAVETVLESYYCADDVSNVGSCTANEVSLSGVTNVTISDAADNPLTSCVNGQTIKIQTLTAELDANTGDRYDVTFWAGRMGNDPRAPGQGPDACFVRSLPDNTGSANILDLEEGGNTDNCEDLEQPPAPIVVQFGGGGTLLTCFDSDNDGMADLQILTTWWQNKNFFCGAGDQTAPFDIDDPVFSPGSPSKCDYVAIPLVPILEPASLTVIKSTPPGNTALFTFNTTGFDAASVFDNGIGSFDLDTSGANPASETDAGLIITDTVNGDTFTITEAPVFGFELASATCTNGDDPLSGVTLLPGDEVSCTFVNVPTGTVTIIKESIGGDGTFGYSGGLGSFDIVTNLGSGSASFVELESGVYQVTETPQANWDLTGLSCGDPNGGTTWDLDTGTASISLDEGESITCTFTNTARGNIAIFKTTAPASSDAFSFTHDVVTGAAVPVSPFSVTAGDVASQPQFVSVPPGTYSVTETDPAPAYDLDNIFCEDSVTGGTASITDVGSRTAIINLDPGETVSCAFDNFARGSLSVTKQVTEDGPSVNDFGFSSGALGAFSLLDVTTATPRTQQFADLATGDYDLAEVDPSANDWVLDSATCSDGTDLLLTGTVFLDVGGDITCTFVNSPLELPPPPPPPAPQIPIPVDGTLALALLVLCMLWIGMTSLRNGRGRSG